MLTAREGGGDPVFSFRGEPFKAENDERRRSGTVALCRRSGTSVTPAGDSGAWGGTREVLRRQINRFHGKPPPSPPGEAKCQGDENQTVFLICVFLYFGSYRERKQ